MRRLLSSQCLRIALVLCSIVMAAIMQIAPVKALPNIGPDPDDIAYSDYYGLSFSSSIPRRFSYVLSRSQYADIPSSRIKIYLPSATGTITIRDPHMCTNRTYTNSSPYPYYADNDISYTAGFGDAVQYRMSNSSGSATSQYGQWSSSSSCANSTISFNVSGSAKDVNTGMYPYVLVANGLANGQYTNLFWITAPTGAIVSPDVTVSAQAFALHVSQPIPLPPGYEQLDPPHPYKNYTHWQLPFGPDCSVTTPTVRDYVEMYDDDNYYNYEAQPRPFFVQMREYDRSGNFLGTIRPYGVRWSDSFGSWGSTTTTPSSDWDGGWATTTIGGSTYDHVYTSGEKQSLRVYYDFKRERIYRLYMHSVYMSNKVQIQLPFESVFYYKQCQLTQATLQPSSTVDKPTIGFPETATFNHYLNASNASSGGSVDYTVQRYRNGTAIGTSQSGTASYSGNGQLLLRTNAYTSAATDLGARICERLTLVGSGNFVNNPSEACTTVAARPYVEAGNNDVWAGARFDYSGNKCSGAVTRPSRIQSWVTNGAGAFGEYGVFALGAIGDFGSARQPGGNGLTFANTPTNGSVGAPLRCTPNYYTAIGTTGAATWTGIGGLPAGGGKRKYAVNGNLTVSAGTVPAGTQATLLVNGNVTITGNIGYANSYASSNDIASLWIVATGNIYVQENVSALSGLYVAQGTSGSPGKIHTCVRTGFSTTYNPLTTSTCTATLAVYGALIADQIYWQRTNGSAAPGQTAAESVQFDPGLYLSNPLSSSGNGTLSTEDTKELPPIY